MQAEATRAVKKPADSVQPRALVPVVVAMVVDQLAAWVANERFPKLSTQGGFARLVREGTWYRDVRFAHAITETAPGHASLFSGRTPSEHGIVANEVLTSGRPAAILLDPNTKLVDTAGIRADVGSSMAMLAGDVVADRFKERNPNGTVVALSIKDRGAIFGGGHHPDLTLWYDSITGAFVSSTAFTNELPAWLAPLVTPDTVTARIAQSWALQDPAKPTFSLTQDDQAGEGDFANLGRVFPHSNKGSTKPFAAYRINPDSDRILLELALSALDHVVKNGPILLAISLSANDYIGHIFGPDSWEAWDELQRLDAALAWFFGELDRKRGAEHWSAILSADHGVAPLPEVSRALAKESHHEPHKPLSGSRPELITERVLVSEVEKTSMAMAKQALGKGDWIAAVVDPYVYLSQAAKLLPGPRRNQLMRNLETSLHKKFGVAKLYDTAAMPSPCPSRESESLDTLACNSIHPGHGGDFFIALRPGYFFDTGYVSGAGTSHGNAGIYDRAVPILVRNPGHIPAGKVVDAPQSFTLYASEIEKLSGLR